MLFAVIVAVALAAPQVPGLGTGGFGGGLTPIGGGISPIGAGGSGGLLGGGLLGGSGGLNPLNSIAGAATGVVAGLGGAFVGSFYSVPVNFI